MSSAERRILYKAGGILIAALALLVFFNVITTAEAINITLIFFLVFVTVIYAKRTAEIAKSTKEQAEETREQRIAMFKPHITMTIRTTRLLNGNYFAIEIPFDLQNGGPGCAINVNVLASHSVFRFDSKNYPNPIEARQTTSYYTLSLHLENDESRPGIKQPVILITNYEDVLGNYWHSTLELRWDAVAKDLRRGRLQVGLPGHFNNSGEHT